MESFYPQGPASVPANLTKASSRYVRHAWLAVLGLLLFILVYFSLAGWFSWSAYHIIMETSRGLREPLWGYLIGGCSAFLGIFMLKALFFSQHGGDITDYEATRASEPRLFEFLYRLADEAGAPRPHRVFLSPRVNACVFYDLSILNFLFSSKKNLEIGLPLVNALTLGELKAVLAHEFGHFAQKSMAVGRWVYIAQQIAGHIIAKRDILDKFLRGLSRFDIRIAWIGWIMSIIIWSIRSLMDSVFSLVVIAQRALSKEMEFQADLVAVSLTGSDALVHALHKLQSADDAWERTLQFANSEVAAGRAVSNLFLVQDNITRKIRQILNDPGYGSVAEVPAENAAAHRIFRSQLGHPPKMWATHPENHQREENAKQHYINAPIDQRSAWILFNDADSLKEHISTEMMKHIECQQYHMEGTLKNLDEFYNFRFLNPGYKGSYLGRSLTLHANNVFELYDDTGIDNIPEKLKALYPGSLSESVRLLNTQRAELQELQALKAGILKAPGGLIRHNGNEYKRSQLNELIEQQKLAVSETESIVHNHDKSCRSIHLQAAKIMGSDWYEYLRGLLNVLHYSEHTLAEVNDIRRQLNNVWNIIWADGNVSSKELKRLIRTCTEVSNILADIYAQGDQLQLDQSLLKRLQIESWAKALGEYTLPNPGKENINDWIQAIDSWFNVTVNAVSTLRRETLDQLLTTEAYVSHKFQAANPAAMNYGISTVPAEYRRMLPGNERKIQTRLGLWDRFQTADGYLGALSRFSVAGGIIGGVLWYGINNI